MLLAIDTATQNAGVALYDQRQVWAERVWFSEQNHTIELMPAIQSMLSQQGIHPSHLQGIAVSTGPGSFTGMRIGLSVAKGFGLSLEVPVVGIPTLDVLAQPFADQKRPVCAVVRAGRGRFCAAIYQNKRGKWRRLGEYGLFTPSALVETARDNTLYCGELDEEIIDMIRQRGMETISLASPAGSVRRAAVLAEMAWERVVSGQGDDLATLAPIYLHS